MHIDSYFCYHYLTAYLFPELQIPQTEPREMFREHSFQDW